MLSHVVHSDSADSVRVTLVVFVLAFLASEPCWGITASIFGDCHWRFTSKLYHWDWTQLLWDRPLVTAPPRPLPGRTVYHRLMHSVTSLLSCFWLCLPWVSLADTKHRGQYFTDEQMIWSKLSYAIVFNPVFFVFFLFFPTNTKSQWLLCLIFFNVVKSSRTLSIYKPYWT